MFKEFIKPRRVVITGFGCVTPIGIGRENFWKSLESGKSGVGKIESFDTANSNVKIAAEVKNFDWEAELNPKDRKHVPRTVPLALAAAREAVKDSGIHTDKLSTSERQNFGILLGTGGGGLAFTEKQYVYWLTGEANKASIYTIPASTHGGFRASFRWFSVCTGFRTSFRPAARVRLTRSGMRRSTSRSDDRKRCLRAASMRRLRAAFWKALI
jgi:hypothetical protein